MSTSLEQAAKALAAWKSKFGDHHIEQAPDEPELFKLGHDLGGGGNGVVYATELDGIPLALKRTYVRKIGGQDLNEIQILRQLSEVRHEHIVSLIGSCVRKRKRVHEIDVIMYPVAQCDLAALLHAMDILMMWAVQPGMTKGERDDASEAVETLRPFHDRPRQSFTLDSTGDVKDLILVGQLVVFKSFKCIAQAVAYMHRLRIRHKDLKPSQILLSPEGLWLTDFGWSLNTAELAQSATSSGYATTVKYQAPERANGKSCGRAEDIFALGCTFLEMAVRLTLPDAEGPETWTTGSEVRWSFQANLGQLEEWLTPLSDPGSRVPPELIPLIRRMMAYKPEDRPSIDEVIEVVSDDTCRCSQQRSSDAAEAVSTPAAKEPVKQSKKSPQKTPFYVWFCCQCAGVCNMQTETSCPTCGTHQRCAHCTVEDLV